MTLGHFCRAFGIAVEYAQALHFRALPKTKKKDMQSISLRGDFLYVTYNTRSKLMRIIYHLRL